MHPPPGRRGPRDSGTAAGGQEGPLEAGWGRGRLRTALGFLSLPVSPPALWSAGPQQPAGNCPAWPTNPQGVVPGSGSFVAQGSASLHGTEFY